MQDESKPAGELNAGGAQGSWSPAFMAVPLAEAKGQPAEVKALAPPAPTPPVRSNLRVYLGRGGGP